MVVMRKTLLFDTEVRSTIEQLDESGESIELKMCKTIYFGEFLLTRHWAF